MNISEVNLHKLTVSNPFLSQYQQLVHNMVISYQWDALNNHIPEAEPSHAIENFHIAARLQEGEFYRMVFQDSNIAKWLEAVAWSLCQKPDTKLEKTTNKVIKLITSTQCEDSYLNTYFTVKAPKEHWSNLAECHELYCASHLIEARVTFFQATGKQHLLEVVCHLANHINHVFGPDESKLHSYPGHPEIELALMHLYEVTEEPRYLALTNYFVKQHGAQPHYYNQEYEKHRQTSHWHTYSPAWMVKDKAYSQAHLSLAQQQTTISHTVHFVYLMTSIAHLAHLSHNDSKHQDCLRLWNNMAQHQLYITSSIGSQSSSKAFTSNYNLPNDTVYTKSCASISLMMFTQQMLEMEGNSQYANVMEHALYNTMLSSMALDGKHFFYVNPLEVHPKSLKFNHIYNHIKPIHQHWFGCACCPPNIAHVLTSIGHYLYTPREDALYINIYTGNSMEVPVENGTLRLQVSRNYPWQEQVTIAVESPQPVHHTLALHLPDWCTQPQIILNGEEVKQDIHKGYLHITHEWQEGNTLNLTLPMPVHHVYSNPLVHHITRKVAIQHSPLVYCLEQANNSKSLHNLWLPTNAPFTTFEGKGLFSHKILIQAPGYQYEQSNPEQQPLWHYNSTPAKHQPQTLTFIPWFSWANQGKGKIQIWVNEEKHHHPEVG